MSWQDVATIAPFIGAVLVACAVLVVDIAWPGRRGPALLTALVGLAVVALLVLVTGASPSTAFGGAYTADPLTTFLDLLVLFLGLELMVLPGYLLVGFAKHDALSTEGAIKYFLLGSFSSAIFLFGLAYVWGLTGTTRVAGVAEALAAVVAGHAPLSAGLAMGLAFMTTGVGFKIAAVPFHYWTPDAYQGSPTPVTGYLSVGPKVGAFALILRLFV